MRFEVLAAFAVGILLPSLETVRRGVAHWRIDFTTMFEDYVGGALLLAAGWAAHRAKPWSGTFLVLAWAYVTGMMGGSFWSQIERTLRGTSAEPNNLLVVAVKLLLWGTCGLALIASFRNACRTRGSGGA